VRSEKDSRRGGGGHHQKDTQQRFNFISADVGLGIAVKCHEPGGPAVVYESSMPKDRTPAAHTIARQFFLSSR
jgi:hypothetical protein